MTTVMATVLVIEDDPDVRVMLATALHNAGHTALSAGRGRSGLDLARSGGVDLVILDRLLPDIAGDAVLESLKDDPLTAPIPVIMLSGQVQEADRVSALEGGADDYVTKPFSARELAARVQVLLRRPRVSKTADDRGAPSDMVEIGAMRIDLPAREVVVDDQPVQLTKIEFDLLATLASRPGMVFTRQVLLEAVWGIDWVGDDHLVSVHIANLRKKIDRDGTDRVTTVRGVGYRLNAAS